MTFSIVNGYVSIGHPPPQKKKKNVVVQIYNRVIPREVAQENPRSPSILMKIDKPIVPHDRNMHAQF